MLLDALEEHGQTNPRGISTVDSLHQTLLVGCQAMQRYSGDADVTERLLEIVRNGLAVGR